MAGTRNGSADIDFEYARLAEDGIIASERQPRHHVRIRVDGS